MRNEAKTIKLPSFSDHRGKLAVVGDREAVPFSFHRAFWIYSVAKGEHRANHAHRSQSQLIVPVNGSFTVTWHNGETNREVTLSSPAEGLLVGPGIWIDIHDFSSDAVCLVLASGDYEESEYIRDHDDFLDFVNKD